MDKKTRKPDAAIEAEQKKAEGAELADDELDNVAGGVRVVQNPWGVDGFGGAPTGLK